MDLDIRPLTLVPTLQQMFAPQSLEPVVELLHQARLSRVNVFVCGRGASAVTVARLVDGLNREAVAPGMPRFRAVALADASVSGAVALAFGEQGGLVEPLRNMLRPGDVVVSMDCDDYCPLDAPAVLRYARQMGARTVALAGEAGDTLAAEADMAVRLPGPAAAEAPHMELVDALIAALRERAAGQLVPGLILAGGRSATPEQPAVLPGTPKRRAILLDRDGVINVNRDDYVKNWEEIELLPGVIDALRLLAQSPYPIVVVTNQSAVNRNHMSYEMAENINLRLMQTVAAQGGRIDAVAWCPHRPDEECQCRKPRPGMLTYLADCLNLDLQSSYLVGDAEGDMEAGMAVGCQTALVLTGRGEAQRLRVQVRWGNRCRVLSDLEAAAQWIVADGYACKQSHLAELAATGS